MAIASSDLFGGALRFELVFTGFFLEGVETTADEAVIAAREVFALVTEDRQRLLVARGASVMAVRLLD
jgi:hypothetical protein